MLSRITETTSPRPLGLTRIVVGIAALIRAIVAWRVLIRLTEPEALLTPYVSWTPEPSVILVVVIVSVWVVAGALFTIGWRVALTGPALLAAIVATLFIDQQGYSNHLYLMAWLVLLLVIADAGAGLNISRSDRPVVRWGVLLLMLQMSIVYGFSALTKLNDEFLSGEVLAGVVSGGPIDFPEGLRTPGFLSILAGVVIVVELYLALFMWRARYRPAAFVLGLGLHASITLLMESTLELLVFSLEMLALYPLFLSRERLVVVWDDACRFCAGWVRRFERLDVLDTVEPMGKSDPASPVPPEEVERSMHLLHLGKVTSGFRAVTGTLEHLVPTLWFAPILRIPGISHLGEWWYRRQARRRSCGIGQPVTASEPP